MLSVVRRVSVATTPRAAGESHLAIVAVLRWRAIWILKTTPESEWGGRPMQKFKNLFQDVPDPRADNARHDLVDVLVIALAAVLCGADNCADMAEFGCAKEALLRQFLRLEHGIPSHDTFSRIFRLLDPQAFVVTMDICPTHYMYKTTDRQ